MANTKERKAMAKNREESHAGEIRSDRETQFTIGDTLGEGKGKGEVSDVNPSEMEKRGRSKRNAMGYQGNRRPGAEREKLVSPEANDL